MEEQQKRTRKANRVMPKGLGKRKGRPPTAIKIPKAPNLVSGRALKVKSAKNAVVARLARLESALSDTAGDIAVGRLLPLEGIVVPTGRVGTEEGSRRLRIPPEVEGIVARAAPLLGTRSAAIEWLTKPSRWLNDRSPLEMIKAGERDDVDRYLSQVEYGVYV